MNNLNKTSIKSDLNTAAVCGLFCPSCTVYIGTVDDPAKLQVLAQQMDRPVEKLQCSGCRSDNLSFYCKTCSMKKCAIERGIKFCSECSDFPCEDIKTFQTKMPHRAELWNSLDQIKNEGWEKWFTDMSEMSSCPDCGTINSAYDPVCRSCGSKTSSSFAKKHKALIDAHMEKVKKA